MARELVFLAAAMANAIYLLHVYSIGSPMMYIAGVVALLLAALIK